MARERPEGVSVMGKAVCPCTVCLLPSKGTSFKFADLATIPTIFPNHFENSQLIIEIYPTIGFYQVFIAFLLTNILYKGLQSATFSKKNYKMRKLYQKLTSIDYL